MKKGFTLVELLAVVTLIGLLSLIVIPVVDKIIKDNKEQLYHTQIKMIEDSARSWAADNIFELPSNNGEMLSKTICDLEKSGFLELDVKNPKTGELFYKDAVVKITKTANGYEYTFDEKSGSSGTNCSR